MRLIFLLLLILIFQENLILAQDQSGSGTISNYQIFCSGSTDQCINTDNGADTIIIEPNVNGEIKITVTLTSGSVTCCDGQIFPQAIGATLRNYTGSQTLFTFQQNATSETTRFCVGPDDAFLLVISGTKGEYQYQVETTSSLYPPEVNDFDNNTLLNADSLQPEVAIIANIGYGNVFTDQNDWYLIEANKQGQLNLAIEIDGRANFFLERLNGTGLDFVYFFAPGNDTLRVDCVQPGDYFYINVAAQSNQCANYSLNYWVDEPGGSNDSEVDSATYAAPDMNHEGRIGFGIYETDLYDGYLIVADDDGELRLNIQGTAFRYTLYTKSNFPIMFTVDVLDGQDTTYVSCVAKLDSFYLWIERFSGSCSDYSFDYQVMEPMGIPDMESNDEIDSAYYALPDMNHEGRIGFGSYETDFYDHYLLVADDDGDLKLSLQGNAFRYLLIENLTKTTIISDSVLAEQDSVILDCIGKKDSFYLLITQLNSFCSKYSFEYSVDSPMTENDSESEEESQGYQMLSASQTVEGRIGYGFYQFEDADRFKIAADATGCLQVIVQGFESGAIFYLRRKDNLVKIDSAEAFDGAVDTLKLDCVVPGDTFYVDVEPFYYYPIPFFGKPICATYKLFYSITNHPSNPPDNAGDNASSATALPNVPGNLSGTVGYGYYNRDLDDVYFLTEMEVNDRPEFQFAVEKDSLRFRLERFGLGLGVVHDFGFISGIETKDYTITAHGLYYLRVSHPGCSSYEVDVDGLLSHKKINGVDLFGAHSAGSSIQLSNSTTCDVTIIAPEVDLLPIINVPLGCTLFVSPFPE